MLIPLHNTFIHHNYLVQLLKSSINKRIVYHLACIDWLNVGILFTEVAQFKGETKVVAIFFSIGLLHFL